MTTVVRPEQITRPSWSKTTVDEFRMVRRRVIRLAIVSAVALGLVFALAIDDGATGALLVLLAAGWLSMPTMLALVAAAPRMRATLAVPATLTSLGVFGMAFRNSPSAGWAMLAAGIALGGVIGAWLWLGWAPSPAKLRIETRSWPRLFLMSAHVGLVVCGLAVLGLQRY